MLTFENLPIVSYTRYLLYYIYVKPLLKLQAKKQTKLLDIVRTYLQPHYGNGVFSNVYFSAGQH